MSKRGFWVYSAQTVRMDVNLMFYWTFSLIWEQNFFNKENITFSANYLSFFIDLILTFNIFLLGQCHTYFSILQMDLFRQTNIFFLNIIAWGDGGKQRLPPPTSKTSEHHCKTKECSDNYAKKTVYEWERMELEENRYPSSGWYYWRFVVLRTEKSELIPTIIRNHAHNDDEDNNVLVWTKRFFIQVPMIIMMMGRNLLTSQELSIHY